MEQNKIRVLKEDAVLQVRFGINFYNRIGALLNNLLQDKSPEQIMAASEAIRDKKPIEEEWIFHYETFLYLFKALEEYAEENNLFIFLTAEEYQQYAAKFVPKETEESSEPTESTESSESQ